MKKLTEFLILFLTSGKFKNLHDETNMDAMLRLIVLNVTYTIISFIILGLGVSDMRNGIIDIGLIQLIIGFAIFMNLSLLRTEFPFIVGGLITITIFGSFCAFTIFGKHELRGLDAIWIYSFPLISIYTLGLKIGLIPAAILFLVTAFGAFTKNITDFQYDVRQAILLCGVYLLVLIITAVYEYVRSIKDRWLVQQDNYLKMVFENSPDIIMLLDKDIHMVYGARVFLDKIGIKSIEEIKKISYREVFARFIPAEQLGEIIAFFRMSRERNTPITFERTIDFGGDGHPLHYDIHFTPMCDANKVFQGSFILFHDMTEIMEAKNRTEQASLAKSTFLANMSHEIRTPLNAIIGMTNIAKSSDDISRKEYCLDKIQNASVHLLGIINDILDMSKIEENKFEISNTEFNFEQMIQNTANLFEFRFSEKKQKFIINLDPLVPKKIITDDQRLSQVITNLIGNAIKFTPEDGEITLAIRKLENAEGNFCNIEINVTDTGIGIPLEKQAKLFQSFTQVDSGISRKYGGTGLGLAISKKIVELMNGKIRIESEPGKGSSFIVTICVEVPDENENLHKDDSSNIDLNEIPNYSGKHILLAEDVEINREIVITLLEPFGLKITEAEDGKEALDLFCENPDSYDLIFMDIHMPGMDGYDAARHIRTFEDGLNKKNNGVPRKQVPIIAMTANVFKEDIENCLAAGMNSHLGKPLDFKDVMKKLKIYLG